MAQLLIIEDEVLLAKSLARSLTGKGHECVTVTTAEEGLKIIDEIPTDIALIDLQLPGMSGFEAMNIIRQKEPDIAVIVITAFGTMAAAVEAMRSGASDFLRKPIDTEELALAVERAVSNARLKHTVSYYQAREAEKITDDRLIFDSDKMKNAVEILNKILLMDLPKSSDFPPVLILGETGTGKDLFAKTIHYKGKFFNQPFVEVNCSSLPRGLEEAELFGYEKGSFTGAQRSKRGLFEAADGGTIFLNEIGDLNLEAQAKILKAIEDKTIRHVGGLKDINIDVRVVAATNRDLSDRKRFREDLYHRLNHLTISLPPLRDRSDDKLSLAKHFTAKFNAKYNQAKSLSPESEAAIKKYGWPGNVRELSQFIERAIFLSSGNIIHLDDLNLPIEENAPVKIDKTSNVQVDFPTDGIDLDDVEREIIIKALESSGGNVSDAARKLKIGREALRYRIKKYSLSKRINFTDK
jgi:DNA-binding NtrC family response regulator